MGNTPVSDVAIRVLCLSLDPGLNHSRALLLRDHGFVVETCESIDKGHRLIETGNYEVLIFGNTLPNDTCWMLEQVFRKHHPRGTMIEIRPSPWAAARSQADATVVGSDEPSTLVHAIRDAVGSRRGPRS